jgi:methionine-rich copper-binding protein CopC
MGQFCLAYSGVFPADHDFRGGILCRSSKQERIRRSFQTDMTAVFGHIVRALLLVFGVIMLLFGVWQLLEPRARYVSSSLQPGSILPESPRSVSITFSEELAPESEISVASTITSSASGETSYGDGKRYTAQGPDPEDPQRRTLRVDLGDELTRGLYWVQWKTVARRGLAQRSGRLCYAVGMPIPAHLTRDLPEGLYERDYQERRRRAALIGGVVLLALGAFVPSRRWKVLR